MYVEQTSEGYNIIDIPADFMPVISEALDKQSNPYTQNDLSKEQKRAIRSLAKLINQECETLG